MRIKKDDTVLVITGKDKGKKGKVLKAIPTESRVTALFKDPVRTAQ